MISRVVQGIVAISVAAPSACRAECVPTTNGLMVVATSIDRLAEFTGALSGETILLQSTSSLPTTQRVSASTSRDTRPEIAL